MHININDYNAPVPELFEAQKEREESNDVDDKADQLQEDIENIDKIIEAFDYLAKQGTQLTVTQLDWPGLSEEDDDGFGLDWCQDL